MASLYERLGGTDGIKRLANDLVDMHAQNPAISKRFANSNLEALKTTAAEFFITGTGGPHVYKGKNMVQAHKGMNISPSEFLAVLDDVAATLKKNGVGQREQEEVLFIFFSMRAEVLAQ